MQHVGAARGLPVSRRTFLGTTAAAVGMVGAGSVLSACSGSGEPPEGGTASASSEVVTWQSWSNGLSEGEQHRQFSDDYTKRTGTKVSYQIVTGNYLAKMLSQLADDTAPDAFYIGDTALAQLIDRQAVEPLDEFLARPDAGLSFADTYPGLARWCTGVDGRVYAIPVDCNPKVMWFNKVVLQAAGVATDPAASFDAGTWTQDACGDLFSMITASGKRAAVVENTWFDTISWLTTFGGSAFDDAGKAIFDTDDQARTSGAWLLEQLQSGAITYGGALPKNQAANALFYSGKLATLGYGRWELPNLARLPKAGMDFDIAPLPSADGKSVAPVAVYTAAMAINAHATNRAGAEKFLAYYCGPDGMRARLTAERPGNAVPSRAGLDDTVTAQKQPDHAPVFVEAARNGYSTPVVLARDPDKAGRLGPMLDAMLMPDALKTLTATKLLTTYANFLNA